MYRVRPRRSAFLAAAVVLSSLVLAGAPPPATAAQGSNLVRAYSFEATGTTWLAPWKFLVTSPAKATIAQDADSRSHGLYSARITTTATSASPWHAQLQQSGIPLRAGKLHTISFWARSSTPRGVRMVLQRGVTPYTEYLARTFDLTTAWRKYTVTVTPGVSVANALLSFNLAGALGQVWIDNVSLTEQYSKFGVGAHLMWGNMKETRQQQTSWMQSGNMKWVRFDLGWRWIEPKKGEYNGAVLARLDATLNDLATKGIRPIIVLVETPAWANGNRGPWHPPTYPQDYARVAGFLAKRYAGRPNMAWEIWNEPNLVETDTAGKPFSKFWMPLANPAAYTALLRAAYTSIKANDPDATVLGGSLVFDASAFLDSMYANGAKGHFDALAIHPYGFAKPPDDTGQYGFTGITYRMRARLEAHGDGHKKIWITEVGWFDRQVTGLTKHPTDAVRADYYTQVADIVNGWSFVEMVAMFSLTKSTDPVIGLVNTDGTFTLSWQGYAAAARE